MIIYEPRWKSLVVETINPIFTSEQCKKIIEIGKSLTKQKAEIVSVKNKYDTNQRLSYVSWIPFNMAPEMYEIIEKVMHQTNSNHFGFENMQITEFAQYTEYPEKGFFDWHIDSHINCEHQPPVRKISMTCLLSHESEFKGGGLEIIKEGNVLKPKQGQAVFFASFIRHRVAPISKGIRKSLVMWFGGTPFK